MNIFIPMYNASKTIVETISSVVVSIESKKADAQIFVYDDFSTDDSCAVVERVIAGCSFDKIVLWKGDRNLGERSVCNLCFDKFLDMGEEWVFVIHADDVAKSNWYSDILDNIELNNSKLGTVCSSWDELKENGDINPGENDKARDFELIEGTIESASNTLLKGCWWHFSGCALNLKVFKAIGGFDSGMPQLGDLHYLIRMLYSGYGVKYLPKSLILYRLTSGSVSSVSFRTNRDLKESLLNLKICCHFEFPQKKIALFVNNCIKKSFRRIISSLLKFDIIRARTSLFYFYVFLQKKIVTFNFRRVL